MTQITQAQYDSLKKEIYDTLMSDPEKGMGEMGECNDAAIEIIDTWMEKNNITLIEEN